MRDKVQVVVVDDRDYILEYRDFKSTEFVNMNAYINKFLRDNNVVKIHIRKW